MIYMYMWNRSNSSVYRLETPVPHIAVKNSADLKMKLVSNLNKIYYIF